MAPERVVRVHAPAKINLSLRVLGVRDDGYHELRTVFQSIALHDTLVVRRVGGAFALSCSDPACPADRTNLVWRAAAATWRASGRRGTPSGFRIELVKRIPMEAGLGGGSSDAAAAVRALGALLRVPDARQRAVAARLGADVPYFFEGGTVLGLDRGDTLFPLVERATAWVVLAVPDFGVSTRHAYLWWDADRAAGRAGPRGTANDLQPPVLRRHPELGRLVRTLVGRGAIQAAMSGSGSAVFGLFASRQAAERAAHSLRGTGARSLLTRTVGRRAYHRLVDVR